MDLTTPASIKAALEQEKRSALRDYDQEVIRAYDGYYASTKDKAAKLYYQNRRETARLRYRHLLIELGIEPPDWSGDDE